MTIKEYIEELEVLAKEYPEAKVIYSKDDEGNKFEYVHFFPTIGNFNDGNFDGEDFNNDNKKNNAICLN